MKSYEAYSSLEKYIFNPILDRYGIADDKKKYILQFYTHGIMAVIKEWTVGDCQDEIDRVIEIIIGCVISHKV